MENQNSVCYTTKINKIIPIERADNIELANVNGWNGIIPTGIGYFLAKHLILIL